MADTIDLGKRGLAIAESGYGNQPQFLSSGLNELKPEMVEEATKKARLIAERNSPKTPTAG